MSDRNEILSQFIDVTGSSEERARFYLEAADWQLQSALTSYYEEGTDPESLEGEAPATDEVGEVRNAAALQTSNAASQSSKNTAKPKPQTTGRIRTLASLNQGNANSSDEDEGQAFYAGGSDSSGQQILGPGKKKKDIVADMFKSVQEHGAEVVDPGEAGREQRPSSSFQGTGYRLGQSSDDSQVVSGTGQRKAQPVNVVLKLWRDGFSVDDGSLRRYSDPENKEFLESIRRGEVPLELIQELKGSEIHLQMEDHRHEDPTPTKSKVKAFSGKGNMLGTPAPGPVTPAAPALDEKAKQALEEAARKAVDIDPGKPQTSIQVRLADGTCLQARLNHSHTIADLRRFIIIARPQYENATFSLLMTFPRKELTDESETVEKAGLLNAAVLQRLMVNGKNEDARTNRDDSRVTAEPPETEDTSSRPSQEEEEEEEEAGNCASQKKSGAQEAVTINEPYFPREVSSPSGFRKSSPKTVRDVISYNASCRDLLCTVIPAGDSAPFTKIQGKSQNSLKSPRYPNEGDTITLDNISFVGMERIPSETGRLSDAVLSNFCNADGMVVLSEYKTITSHECEIQDVPAVKRVSTKNSQGEKKNEFSGKELQNEGRENSLSLHHKNENGTMYSSNSETSYSSYFSDSVSPKIISTDSKESQDKNSSLADAVARSEHSNPRPCMCSSFSAVTISIPCKRGHRKSLSRKVKSSKSGEYITFKLPLRRGKTMPSILVSRASAESDREIKIIFPNEERRFSHDNSQTSDKSGLGASGSTEVQRVVSLPGKLDERSVQSVGTSCDFREVYMRHKEKEIVTENPCDEAVISSNSPGLPTKNAFTFGKGQESCDVPTETERVAENLPKTDSLKRLVGRDALAYWSMDENATCAFSEKYLNANSIYETLSSFCSDVDGTFHETGATNLCVSDRIFPCRGTSTFEILTSLEPLVTSPTDKYSDNPVSFVRVATPKECSRQRETLGRVFHCSPSKGRHRGAQTSDARSQHSKVPPNNRPGEERLRRTHPRAGQRAEHGVHVHQRAPKGAFVHNSKRSTVLFVARRKETLPNWPEAARFAATKQRPHKQGVTPIANYGKAERDQLRVTSPVTKRRLRTSPEKL